MCNGWCTTSLFTFGHVRLMHTQAYLTMTPELLQLASTSFERYARGEGTHA